jgi:DNA-directed RNA polymerase subunit RPC12/RpoP
VRKQYSSSTKNRQPITVPRVQSKIECPSCGSPEVTLVHTDYLLYWCCDCKEHFDEPGWDEPQPKNRRRGRDDWDDNL